MEEADEITFDLLECEKNPDDKASKEIKCTENISSFRRLAPQILVTLIKSSIIVNKNLFDGLSSLVIPSLTGIDMRLNPNETIRITSVESSWLSFFTMIGHPFGSVLSGFISDAFGRRRALMMVVAPAVLAFLMLGMANSYSLVSIAFLLLSFIFGLKDAPLLVYISEIAEPSVRGTLLSFFPIAQHLGLFIVFSLGTFLSWRNVSFCCAFVPIAIVTAIYFIPESPNWLLSRGSPMLAQRSLQWLRGWVPSELVHDEFTKLHNHSIVANSCGSCIKQSMECPHPKPLFFNKLRELTRKRNLKPFTVIVALNFFLEFSLSVWRFYIIQVLNAFGMPLDAKYLATFLSSVNIAGSFYFLLSVKVIGKRRLYLYSSAVAVLCSFGLSAFGFILFPPNWTSFRKPGDPTMPDFDFIRQKVGNYGYVALALLINMQFFSVITTIVPPTLSGEIFSFRMRSFLCGLTLAIRFVFGAIAAKSYFNMEMWLTLPGATLFYSMITMTGLIVMYFILPETEQRSLEDIELHFADNTKNITDIHILMNSKSRVKTLQ